MDISNLKFDTKGMEKNKIKIGYVVITLIFVWVGYAKIYSPAAGAINSARTEISDEDAKKVVTVRLAGLQDNLNGYRQYFASGRDISWLIDKVSGAAKESGLEITALNPQPIDELSGFLRCNVSMSLTGTYHELGDFVARIENYDEFVKIETLSFKKEGEGLSARAVVSTYFWK